MPEGNYLMLGRTDHSSGQIVAETGEQIYSDLFQQQYEKDYGGQYVVIDVVRKRAYVAETAADALIKERVDDPDGLFHLVKIQGSPPKGLNSYLRNVLQFFRRVGDIKLP